MMAHLRILLFRVELDVNNKVGVEAWATGALLQFWKRGPDSIELEKGLPEMVV